MQRRYVGWENQNVQRRGCEKGVWLLETVSDLVMSGTGAIDGWVSARDEAGKVSRSHVTKAPVCPAKDFAFDLKTSRAIERILAEEREAQSDWHLQSSL